MKIVMVLSFLFPLFSCLSPQTEGEFFVESIMPSSGEFEGGIDVKIKFSKPVNRDKFSVQDIKLVDVADDTNQIPITLFEFNESSDTVSILAEDVEPDRYYNILISGKIMSEDNLLLSYYYSGDFISGDKYHIKGKNNPADICLVINEVLSYTSESNNYEFIEIFNCSRGDVDLRGYSIKIDENRPQRLLFHKGSYNMKPHQYSIILSNIQNLPGEPVIYVSGRFGKNGMSNTSLKSIKLINERGEVLSEFIPFGKAKRGVSYERINPYNTDNTNNWWYSIAESGATPGSQNSVYMKDVFPPKVMSYSVIENDFDMEVMVEFDEDITCENNQCIYLISPSGKRINGIVRIEGSKLLFSPAVKLEYDTEYKLYLSTLLRDSFYNSYPTDVFINLIKTPPVPPIKLYFPQTYKIPAGTKFFEIISSQYNLDTDEVYFAGLIQKLRMQCVRSQLLDHYLCTVVDQIDGAEDMCLYVDNINTNLCIQFIDSSGSATPYINIRNMAQIKDHLYIEADTSIPCLLFVDFIYKEDADETFSYSTYSFSQYFNYDIRIQDPYKEYYVEIYCIDSHNNYSSKVGYSTSSYNESEYSLIINEVLPNPVGYDTPKEFIEVMNTGNTMVDLSRISIGGCKEKPISINKMSREFILPNEVAIIVASNSVYYENNMSCAVASGAEKIIGRDLKNTSYETLCLYYDGILMDVFSPDITISKEGYSLVRIDRNRYFDKDNWRVSDIVDGTPCKAL